MAVFLFNFESMRYRFFIFLLFFIFSCQQQEKEITSVQKVDVAELDFPETNTALVGTARETAVNWEPYVNFETAFENYDHSIEATQRLATLVGAMRQNLLADFDNQPIRSRILVLETRLKRYASFLGYTNKTAEGYQENYGRIVMALDHLRGQLNEKSYVDQLEQQLIEELKSDLRDLDGMASDSIP